MELGRMLLDFWITVLPIALTVNADANVTIQLVSYSNPTFGLAADNYFCAYLSPNVPSPPSPRGSLPVARTQQQNGFVQPQFQNQPQYQQQYQNQQQQYAPNRQNGQLPYGQGIPNQQQYQQQQYLQQQQYQPQPQPQQQQQFQQAYQQRYPQQQQPQQQYYQQHLFDERFPGQQQCVPPQREFNQPNWNECKFSFATVFSTFGGSPKVVTTGLISLPSQNATIDFTQTTWNDKCNLGDCSDKTWVAPHSYQFKVKPNIIQVIATHYGDTVWLNNGVYTSLGNDQASIVDTISINIAGLVPAAAHVIQPKVYQICANGDQYDSNNNPLSTLNLVVSVQCRPGFYGQYCNLTNCTTYNNETQVCSSSIYPGQSLACHYDNVNMQPVNCTICPYGVAAGQCRNLDSVTHVKVVNVTGYIVGISILAILLAIAIAVIIILLVTNTKHKDEPPTRRTQPPPTTTSTGWFGTKIQNKNGAPNRSGYAAAANEEPTDSEWQQPRRNPVGMTDSQAPPARPYNFPPPPARPSSSSTPENAPRREAAV